MLEYERKFRVENTNRVHDLLEQHGFDNHGTKHEVDTYFIAGRRDSQGRREYLRVREDQLSGASSIGYHVALDEEVTRETETDVGSPDHMIHILIHQGMSVLCVVDKMRHAYQQDTVRVTIDHVKNAGDFVEVEVQDESDLKLLDEVCELLELKDEDLIRGHGYPEMVMRK